MDRLRLSRPYLGPKNSEVGHFLVIIVQAVDGPSIPGRVIHVPVGTRAFHDVIADQEVVRLLMVIFGRLAGHIRKRLVLASGFTMVDQVRVLLGKAVCDFMHNDIQPDEWMSICSPITETIFLLASLSKRHAASSTGRLYMYLIFISSSASCAVEDNLNDRYGVTSSPMSVTRVLCSFSTICL